MENTPPKYGFLVNTIHLKAATEYEKLLRRNKVIVSPNYVCMEVLGVVDELIVSRSTNSIARIRPRMRAIKAITPYNFILSNNDIIDKALLHKLYRQPMEYEIRYYLRRKNKIKLTQL